MYVRAESSMMGGKNRRIEYKTSRTAQFTCMSRASSYYEKRPQYRCDDHIAPRLVPKFIIPYLKLGFLRRSAPRGIYEYVVARTRYIDGVFKKAVSGGFAQVLVMGAGFDSRGIRFLDGGSETRVFEMDVPVTQNAKIGQLRKRKIEIPPNLVFIPVDFNRESPEIKLGEAGFSRGGRSLFVLEGLLMYLDPGAVDATFELMGGFAGAGSEVVFDYVHASVLRGENTRYGEEDIVRKVRRANEAWAFGLEEGELGPFLRGHGFKLVENLDSRDLEKRYFTDGKGGVIGRVNGTHCIAHAKR